MSSLNHHNGHLEAIDLELGLLSIVCGVSLVQPGVIEAILHGEEGICRRPNPIAWGKLRGLLVLHYHVVAKRIETDGQVMAVEHMRQSAEKARTRLGQHILPSHVS